MKKSQSMKLLPIAALLIITPLLSTSLRFKYLYFIVNVLIIAVGAEAGLLSFLRSEDNKKSPAVKPEKASPDISAEKPVEAVGECLQEKVSTGDEEVEIEKCSPDPSIFFIGGGEESGHAEEELTGDDERDDDGRGDVGAHELYQKAEMFIGDFYKQLKMQREESWKKLHCHLPQKEF